MTSSFISSSDVASSVDVVFDGTVGTTNVFLGGTVGVWFPQVSTSWNPGPIDKNLMIYLDP